MLHAVSDIAKIDGIIWEQLADINAQIEEIAFDSRKIIQPEKSIFCAIKTDRNNGHLFIESAYEQGVRNFLISDKDYSAKYSDANYFICMDVTVALQNWAIAHRKNLGIPILAVSGSNGKTIVKEWLYQLLKHDYNIFRSARSFNSQLGVAISILGIEKQHEMAIIEAGISGVGEMEKLAEMIKPNMVIFTGLGSAHDEGFSGKEQKLWEKWKLLETADVVVAPGDEDWINAEKQRFLAKHPLVQWISWGRKENNKFKIRKMENTAVGAKIQLEYRTNPILFEIPFSDEASIQNSASCVAALFALERLDENHLEYFKHLPVLKNRLTFTKGTHQNFIVNDTYSNDPESLQIALDFAERQQPDMPQILVITDFEQINKDKITLYKKVSQIISGKKIESLILVGEDLLEHQEYFQTPILFTCRNADELCQQFQKLNISRSTIILKGARKFGLEKLLKQIEFQEHETVLEIDLEALKHNFYYFKNRLNSTTKIMPMVKAFGYGSGSFETAKLLESCGADYFSVAYIDEGILLRNAGVKIPILVLNGNPEQIETFIQYNLQPTVFSVDMYEAIQNRSDTAGLKVHLELDSGMHRLGFYAEELIHLLKTNKPKFEVVGFFSHLSASENPEFDTFTISQIDIFEKTAAKVEEILQIKVIKHILNSGGILRFPTAQMDMVRLGIGLYGVDPGDRLTSQLHTVASLKTRISQIKEIAAGESVGYSRKAISNTARKIAILPIGYADGVWRAMGNGNASVYLNGRRCKILGNICMDMCMIEVTEVNCSVGDEVEIFGNYIPVEEISKICGTIPYETLTAVSQRVKRVFIGND